MDSLLKGLFGDQDDDDTQRNRAQDFVSRYDQGSPYEGISDDEVLNNYQRVAGRISPQEYEDSATEAYARLSPQERQQFAQYLQQQGGVGAEFNSDDPRQLAQYTSRLHQEQPDGIAGLLGGMGGGGLGGLLGGALGGQSGGTLQNPMAKAVLGGIAAMAMKRMMGHR
jgi:hypothetical protein